MASVLTPFQVTTTANLLYNEGISVNAELLTNIAAYNNLPYVKDLNDAIANVNVNSELANIAPQLYSLAENTCPALSDSIPSSCNTHPPKTLFSDLIVEIANSYVSSNSGKDVTIFCQGFSALQGYNGVTNSFINSAVNSQTYLGGVFPGNDSLFTGGITDVNVCTSLWGSDLKALGGLIDLSNLEELGTPWSIVRQLAKAGGITPDISTAFFSAGVDVNVVINLTSPSIEVSDTNQKAMYTAMTQITGTTLDQVLTLLGVTTPNINTMADLLNPYKIFPNSFQSLTVTGINGVSQNIYLDSAGTVNSTVQQYLPKVASSTLS